MKNKSDPIKKLGKLTVSATALRKIANRIQKKYKTKGDVVLDCNIYLNENLKGEKVKTIGWYV